MVSFDRIANTYDSTREALQPQVLEALARQLTACRSVLEVGIGTGRLARPLLDRGVNVVGVDASRGMLEAAPGHLRVARRICWAGGMASFTDETLLRVRERLSVPLGAEVRTSP